MKNYTIPEVSSIEFLKNAAKILKNPLPFHAANFKKKGPTFRLKLGFGNSVVFSKDAGFLQHALQKNKKNYAKSPIQTKDLAKYVGKGLLTSEGALWQKQRKLIQPAFHKKQLVFLLESIQKAITTEISKISTQGPLNVAPVFNDLAFKTVVKALFSDAADAVQISKMQHITEAAQKMLVKELRQPYLGWWFKSSGKIKKHIGFVQESREVLGQLVAARKKSNIRQDDLLDMLLDARYEDGSGMSQEQLIDEILILFVAGHETTSNALTFASQLLAQHPEVQENIFNEVQKAMVSTTDLMEILKACAYTKNVVEETLRMYPPAYFIDRISIEADTFEGMNVPKNSNLLFSVLQIHNDVSFWEQPELFNPARFSGVSPNTFSGHYFPFGAGPRMCIGNNFAMYEMVLAIATLVKQYKISEKKTPIEIEPLITLKPINAFLEFTKRV
jgi:cytochrome P450